MKLFRALGCKIRLGQCPLWFLALEVPLEMVPRVIEWIDLNCGTTSYWNGLIPNYRMERMERSIHDLIAALNPNAAHSQPQPVSSPYNLTSQPGQQTGSEEEDDDEEEDDGTRPTGNTDVSEERTSPSHRIRIDRRITCSSGNHSWPCIRIPWWSKSKSTS